MKSTIAAAALAVAVMIPGFASAEKAGCYGAMPTAQSQTSVPPVQTAQVSMPVR